jgi:hypothetical protein
MIDLPDEPGHQALCDAEQAFVCDAIADRHRPDPPHADAVQSLRICLAADEASGPAARSTFRSPQ